MKNKNTDGLRQELMDSPDLTQFLSQNEELFANKSVAELLTHLFEKKHISKAALAKQAGMSEIYLHQIFAGRRTPSRNRLLCLCYGLEASIEETQELLRSPSFIRNGNATLSFIMVCSTGSICSQSMTAFLMKMKIPCAESTVSVLLFIPALYLSFTFLYSVSIPEINVFIVYSSISFPNASDDSLIG